MNPSVKCRLIKVIYCNNSRCKNANRHQTIEPFFIILLFQCERLALMRMEISFPNSSVVCLSVCLGPHLIWSARIWISFNCSMFFFFPASGWCFVLS